jgi:hypothetical protein
VRGRAVAAWVAALAVVALMAAAGCGRRRPPAGPTTVLLPTPSIQVGACGEPGRDGVQSSSPRLDRADRDLDGDGVAESVVVDRALCTAAGNCYWNVFLPPRDGGCARYVGTFAASALEPLSMAGAASGGGLGAGEAGMRDVRGYWSLGGGRILLQTYRFLHGGYQVVDVVLCRRGGDDRLDCVDPDR